ncbi:sulfate ABC transporter permease subunit CysW [Halotalea alkalilenta]|uniref:Sulfate/thiosulfate transporter permease subunit n=1 Tax=Halotalea alkalilenta TaxID=376489 RepID=A0A172YGX0_9GAMM|nr:sulfate ABC transporter permease subunit CysW [Halotalea alkalilenta]ANF58457.1 sulfate/thiosulfate transporter permease subunit [Halotalea alkalilenta]
MRRIGDSTPVRVTLILLAVVLSALVLLVPLVAIVFEAFARGIGPFITNLTDYFTVQAIWLTLLIAVITVPVNLVFGIFLAWLVTRFSFPGRRLLQTLIDIPFAVSPVIAGLLYLLLYGRNGWLGQWLDGHDVQLMFAWPGMLLVTIFVTCPFVARELIPLMQAQGSREEEAAVTLGANGWTLFRRVTLPNVRTALIYGVILTNARAMGEFGAVSVVSGAIRGQTLTLPLMVQQLYQDYNTVGAFVAALLLAVLAVLTLVVKALLDTYAARKHAP